MLVSCMNYIYSQYECSIVFLLFYCKGIWSPFLTFRTGILFLFLSSLLTYYCTSLWFSCKVWGIVLDCTSFYYLLFNLTLFFSSLNANCVTSSLTSPMLISLFLVLPLLTSDCTLDLFNPDNDCYAFLLQI